jgi:hypothetical protein
MKKLSITLISSLMPLMAFAQPAVPSTGISTYAGVVGVINTIGNWMFGLLLALAVIFLLYAAFLYLTAAGDSSKTDKAKDIIIYAIVAIVVAVLAKGIIMVAQSLVGSAPVTPGT